MASIGQFSRTSSYRKIMERSFSIHLYYLWLYFTIYTERRLFKWIKKTKRLVSLVVALVVVITIGMIVTGQPAKMMMESYREGSPFNPNMHNTLAR